MPDAKVIEASVIVPGAQWVRTMLYPTPANIADRRIKRQKSSIYIVKVQKSPNILAPLGSLKLLMMIVLDHIFNIISNHICPRVPPG